VNEAQNFSILASHRRARPNAVLAAQRLLAHHAVEAGDCAAQGTKRQQGVARAWGAACGACEARELTRDNGHSNDRQHGAARQHGQQQVLQRGGDG
jgi:hypothetical protein